MLVEFKWIAENGKDYALITINVDSIKPSKNRNQIEERVKAYYALAEIIGEDNIKHCVIS